MFYAQLKILLKSFITVIRLDNLIRITGVSSHMHMHNKDNFSKKKQQSQHYQTIAAAGHNT